MRLITYVVTLLLLCISNTVSAELTIPSDKAVIQFNSKLGVVTFAHEKHAGLKITECKTCHHKIEPADTVVKACHECHKPLPKGQKKAEVKEGEAPPNKTAFHTRCIGCHEYTVSQGMEAGPLKKKCKICHIKQKKQ